MPSWEVFMVNNLRGGHSLNKGKRISSNLVLVEFNSRGKTMEESCRRTGLIMLEWGGNYCIRRIENHGNTSSHYLYNLYKREDVNSSMSCIRYKDMIVVSRRVIDLGFGLFQRYVV